MYGLIFGFPIPIILALLFSEVKNQHYRSFLQVASYLPHFVSAVVVTQIIRLWCEGARSDYDGGILYQMFVNFGWMKTDTGTIITEGILLQPKFFRPIYQVSGVWEGAGYGSIVYFAAILAISPTSYEAARIDGAHEFRIFNQIVLPLMKPAIAVQAIFTFVASWNNYFIPSLLLNKDSKKTLPILIAQLRSADFLKFDMGKVYMMLGFAILPVIVVYLCLSKFIVRGVTLGGVKG